MEESTLLCRFTQYTDAANNEVGLSITPTLSFILILTLTLTLIFNPNPNELGPESEAGAWTVGAAVVANNIVSCAARADARAQGTGGAAGGEASHGWHRVTVLTAYMDALNVSVPFENGASFLFYPAPDSQGLQPTHGGYTATGTDAGHRRPQQADAGTLTLRGAFPTPSFLEPSVRPACRIDNHLVVDATVDETLGSASCAFPPHALGQVGLAPTLSRTPTRTRTLARTLALTPTPTLTPTLTPTPSLTPTLTF